MTSDAAGSLGFKAYFKNEWFSGTWAPSQSHQSIAYKELFPIVVASHVWGPHWYRHISRMSGSVALGPLLSPISPLHTRNCSQLWSHRMSGDLIGIDFYFQQAPTLILHLPLCTCPAFTILLLTPSLVFVGKNSGAWPPKLSLIQS